jgi:hypothetical protein
VQRICQLQPNRHRTFKRSRDPDFVVGPYVDPPRHAV